jgi:glycerol-3-phosphate dehydrogenase
VGGKITAYRAIAEEVTDVASRKLGAAGVAIRESSTASTPLPGADGSRARAVAALAAGDASLAAPLCPHHKGVAAEIVHAVRSEWARTIGDTLLRRTALGLAPCQGLDCIDAVGQLMGRLLGWDAERIKSEIAAYFREIEPMRRFSLA